ncbi:hypothetical protein DXG01_004083 [Tephrocybe rancida]|nr:hypothetical protein DXG01_004083 [Tephrocybe rancida]
MDEAGAIQPLTDEDIISYMLSLSAFLKGTSRGIHRHYMSASFIATQEYWRTLLDLFNVSKTSIFSKSNPQPKILQSSSESKVASIVLEGIRQHWQSLYPIYYAGVDEAISNTLRSFQAVSTVDPSPSVPDTPPQRTDPLRQEDGSDTETEAHQPEASLPGSVPPTLHPQGGVFELDYCGTAIAIVVVKTFVYRADILTIPTDTNPNNPPPPTARLWDTDHIIQIYETLSSLEFIDPGSTTNREILQKQYPHCASNPEWFRLVTFGPPVGQSTANFLGVQASDGRPLVASGHLCLTQRRQPTSVRTENASKEFVDASIEMYETALWSGSGEVDNIHNVYHENYSTFAKALGSAPNWKMVYSRAEQEIQHNMLSGIHGMCPELHSDLLFIEFLLEVAPRLLQMESAQPLPPTENLVDVLPTNPADLTMTFVLGSPVVAAPIIFASVRSSDPILF